MFHLSVCIILQGTVPLNIYVYIILFLKYVCVPFLNLCVLSFVKNCTGVPSLNMHAELFVCLCVRNISLFNMYEWLYMYERERNGSFFLNMYVYLFVWCTCLCIPEQCMQTFDNSIHVLCRDIIYTSGCDG
eukprot:TRINITY_DN49687_c0_g1_i1.p1 TRINITY_DN49687_c0_g1~~TRINITY_DN49687_c0_g1_i1.p1  ORF type:complete len:131 (-),score=6.00 TRINITY_DN49687_c0_g1_i1:238-630(-)